MTEAQPDPARADGDLDWLALVRDAGSRRTESEQPATDTPSKDVTEPVTDPVSAPDAEPVWAEGFTPLSIDAPADDEDLPSWISALRAEDDAATPPAEPEPAEPAVLAEPEPESEPESEPADWKSRFQSAVADEDGTPDEPGLPVVHRVRQAATPEPEPEPAPEPAPEPVAEKATRTSTTPDAKAPAEVHEFEPRRGTRRLVGAVLLVGVVITAYLAYDVYRTPDQTAIALTAVAAFATAVVWAIWATSTTTLLTVRSGKLEVVRDGTTTVFDLATDPLEFVGTPGHRGWKAMFVRQGKPPYEITSRVVDPVEFSRVVRSYRPGEAA